MNTLIGDLPAEVILFSLFALLLTGVIITIMLVKEQKKTIKSVILLSAIFFHAFNFYIIYDLLTPSPQVSSGNGNPNIPYIFVSFLLFLSFCIVLTRKMSDTLRQKRGWLILIIMVIASTISYFSFVYQLDFISTIKEELYYPLGSWWSWWESIHLNSLYFNPYTFLMGMSISVLVAGVFAVIKKRQV
ncbi:hypothetical protein P6709_05840 [Jeotgalibacillus sp. ET6]|uniref:hypothetical protein n=1 Tax=Jeotgalibacillus sp. ET6 TaxID=3037260 RepID=UPI00241835FA|nr:hypothetical protein [Jeotgalibacillus sp. ET6]MDG5471262.1 hypothetical protein [Jeotgalibacillus sp. ET6]